MPTHIIELDDYEVANLRAALGSAFLDGGPLTRNPMGVLNNGDWIGTVLQKLPSVEQQPNASAADIRTGSIENLGYALLEIARKLKTP